MKKNQLTLIIVSGILLFVLFFLLLSSADSKENTYNSVTPIENYVLPKSIIRTPIDENGLFYLVCEGECGYFDKLNLDPDARFEYGYQAVNYYYDHYNTEYNAKLGPLTPYDTIRNP